MVHVQRLRAIADLELREGRTFAATDTGVHVHDQCGFTLVEGGGWRRQIIGRAGHDVRPGEVFVNNAGEPHRGTSAGPWSFRSLYVPAKLLVEAAGELGAWSTPEFGPAPLRDPRLARQFSVVCDAIVQPATALERQSLLLATLVDMVTEATGRSRPQVGRERLATARVDDYVRAHVAADIHLDDLAAAAGLSKYHLLRVFRAERGVTPHELQRRLRVAWARVLLTSGMRPLRVAIEVGYHDQSHLTRSFKRTTGMTPARFQRIRLGGSVAADQAKR